jgi:hypothetical protein
MKKCSRCGLEKTFDRFSPDKTNPQGYTSQCKKCRAEKNRQHYKDNKEYYRNKRYLYDFGITAQEVDKMKEDRNHLCDICKNTHTKLVVDHCHDTGKIRGILCDDCNVGIGRLKDDADLVMSAYVYLTNLEDII